MINLPIIGEGLIGTIDLKSGSVEVNGINPISFNCHITGRCCKQNQIPIVDHEIKRIENAGFSDFISDFPPVATPEGMTYWMKRIDSTCIFLDESKCKIHEIKPFSCRIFPFHLLLKSDGTYDVIVSETNSCDNVKVSKEKESTNKLNLLFVYDLLRSYLIEISD